MDDKTTSILAKYTDPYDIVDRLKSHLGAEKAGSLLWELDRSGQLDCSTDSWFWSTMDDADIPPSGADVAALLDRISKQPNMAGLTGGWSDDHGWNIYFTKMVKAVTDSAPLVALWPEVAVPMKHQLGFRLVIRGDLDACQLGDEAKALMARIEADGTNFNLSDFDSVWPGSEGGEALAAAAGEPDCSIWSEAVVERLIPHATPEQLARVVLNLDYGPTVVKVAELLDPVPEGLGEAILGADRDRHERFGLHMAAVVLAKAGIADEDFFAHSLTKACAEDCAALYARAWQVFSPEVTERHVAPKFQPDKRGYGDSAIWAWLPELPLPRIVEAACDAVRSWPRGEPYLRRYALPAFKNMPRAAAPIFAEQSIAKFPQRDLVAWGLASSGGPLAWPKLIELLADTSAAVREAAVAGLADPGAVPLLKEATKARKKAVREGAQRALDVIAPQADEPAARLPHDMDIATSVETLQRARWDEEVQDGVFAQLAKLPDAAEPAFRAVLVAADNKAITQLWWWYARCEWPGVGDFCLEQLASSHKVTAANAQAACKHLGLLAPDLLRASKADVRIAAAELYAAQAGPKHVEVLTRAFEAEKSKKVRGVLAEVLEACVSAGERPLEALGPDDLVELDARFARRKAEAPVELEGLELAWADGTPVSPEALRGLLTAVVDREDLSVLRPLFDAGSASALRAALEERTRGTKDNRYGWVVALTSVCAQEHELADYGRPLDELARGGGHLEAFARLDALEKHGSSTALQWVDHWSRRARSNGLRERAGMALDRVAKRYGLTRDGLAERLLSDFGLDARGRRDFDYAGRSYELRLGNDLRFHVFFEGAERKDLPAAKSDADKARRKEFSALKKSLKTGVKAAVERLEAAMVEGRAWSLDAWREVFDNPINRRLAEQLVWIDEGCAFRVAEDGSFADLEDEEVTPTGLIRVAHPLRLDDPKGWAEVLADYELLPPFPQLDRPCLAVEDATATSLDSWITKDVHSGRLRGFMSRNRWIRGAPQDGGAVLWMVKPFRAADVTAVLDFQPGLGMGYDFEENQEIRELTFVRGVHSDRPGYRIEGVPLSEVDPVVYAEVVASIEALYED